MDIMGWWGENSPTDWVPPTRDLEREVGIESNTVQRYSSKFPCITEDTQICPIYQCTQHMHYIHLLHQVGQ